jgi:hypothetical protein
MLAVQLARTSVKTLAYLQELVDLWNVIALLAALPAGSAAAIQPCN